MSRRLSGVGAGGGAAVVSTPSLASPRTVSRVLGEATLVVGLTVAAGKGYQSGDGYAAWKYQAWRTSRHRAHLPAAADFNPTPVWLNPGGGA